MREKLSRWFDLPHFPVVLAPFLLYFAPLWMGQVLFWGLPATQFVPWRVYALEQMLQGLAPLWNPLNGLGAPLLANYQLALFYPPGWPVYLAGVAWGAPGMAWVQTLLVPVHLAWAGLGMAWLGRRLGFSRLGQTLAGLAFGLSGYWVARAGFFSMIWAGVWLPWIILGACELSAPVRGFAAWRGRMPLKFGLVAAITLQLLAGHAQLSWYSLTLTGVWVLVGGWTADRWKGAGRATLALCINGLLAAGLAAVQLLPTAEFLLQSQRAGAVDFELGLTYSFWPWRFLTWLAPGFFGSPAAGNYWGYASYWEDATYLGFIPLVLAVMALGWLGRSGKDQPYQPLVRLALGLMAVGTLLALGNNTPLFSFLYRWVPTFSLFNAPARWMIWVVFGVSLLAGIGAGRWQRPTGKALRRLKRLVAVALALTLGAGITWLTLRAVQITFIEATAMLGVWATGACLLTLIQPRDSETSPAYRRWSTWVVLWVAADLLWAGWNSQPVLPESYFAPDQPSVYSGSGRVFLSAEDEYALKIRRFFRFGDFRAIEDWSNLRQVALPNLNLMADTRFAFVNNFDPLVPGRYARWMQALEDASELQRSAMLQMMSVTQQVLRDPYQALGIRVVERPASDRVRWLSCAIRVDNAEDAWRAVQLGLAEGPAAVEQELVFEGVGAGMPRCVAGAKGTAKIIEEQADRIRIAVEAPITGYILLADSWYPGWQVTVDGQVVDLWHANYLFRGLAVPAGSHVVEFRYRPVSFSVGLGVSGALLFLVILLSLLIKYRVQLSKIRHTNFV